MPDYIPLAFGLEALFPPMKLQAAQLREFYIKVADPCRFTEFRQRGDGAQLAEGKNRYLNITPDRVIYRDDITRAMFSTFIEDVDTILALLREVVHIPILLHCKVLVRLLLPYPAPENTMEYFQRTLLQSAVPHFTHFNRPISGLGLRLVFPPTLDNHSTFHLRIEPYFPDLKMFFIENNAQFFDPLVQFKDIRVYLNAAYDFVKEQAGPFVLSLPKQE